MESSRCTIRRRPMKRLLSFPAVFIILIYHFSGCTSISIDNEPIGITPTPIPITPEPTVTPVPTMPPMDIVDEAIIKAIDLGIADEELLRILEENISQLDAVKLVKNADDIYYGMDHSQYLIDMLGNVSSDIDATKYLMAQSIYYSRYEEYSDVEYIDAESWMTYCDSMDMPDGLRPDSSYFFMNVDKSIE